MALTGQIGIRPTEAIFCLRMICERATLLAKPLYITKIDIVKAFDRILIAAVNRAYEARGVSDATRMAFIREMISEYMVFAYKGRKTKPMKRKRGARQGGPDSMDGFAVAFDVCVDDIIRCSILPCSPGSRTGLQRQVWASQRPSCSGRQMLSKPRAEP